MKIIIKLYAFIIECVSFLVHCRYYSILIIVIIKLTILIYYFIIVIVSIYMHIQFIIIHKIYTFPLLINRWSLKYIYCDTLYNFTNGSYKTINQQICKNQFIKKFNFFFCDNLITFFNQLIFISCNLCIIITCLPLLFLP